jgi:hypothetical protein
MPDIRSILDPLPVDNEVKARAWDAFHSVKSEDEFRAQFDAISDLPREAKAALWDAKFSGEGAQPGIDPKASLHGTLEDSRRELGRHGLTAQPPQPPQFEMKSYDVGSVRNFGRPTTARVTSSNLQNLLPPPAPMTKEQAGAELDRIARRQPAMPAPAPPPVPRNDPAERMGFIRPRPTPTMQDANAALAGTGLEVRPPAPPALPYVDDRSWLDKPPAFLDIRNAPKGSFLQRAYAGEIGKPQSAERVVTAGSASTLEALAQLATPRNFAIMAGLVGAHVLGAAVPPLAPAVGALDVGATGYFSYEMVKSIVDSAPEAKRALDSGDYETAARIIGPAAVNAALSYGLVTKVGRPGFEAVTSVRRAADLFKTQQAHLDRASRASTPFDRQAAMVAAESVGKEMGQLPTPSLMPPVPSPSGVTAYVKQQSEIGPATAIIPDRLFGLTPHQRKLIESLGPDLANQLPSRITEPGRPSPRVEAGIPREGLTQAPLPLPAAPQAPRKGRFGSERGTLDFGAFTGPRSEPGAPVQTPQPPFKQPGQPAPAEARMEELLIPRILATHEQTGGSTYNFARGENLAGKPFYSVAAHGELGEIVEGPLTPQRLVAFLNKPGVREKLADPSGQYSMGTWLEKDTGKTYLDVVVTVPNRVQALEIGRNTKPDPQIAIFDLSKVDPKTGSVAEGAEIQVPLGSTKLYHYSKQPELTEIDPKFYGSAQAGAESRRKMMAEPGKWVDRSYYTGEPKPPEFRFGPGTRSPHLYEAEIPSHRVYDLTKDPEGLIQRGGGDITSVEALIRDSGYAGYRGSYGDGSPVYAVFESLPAKPLSARLQEAADNASARIRERIAKSETTLSANPADLAMTMVDLSIWGAAKMAKGTVDFAKWSSEMMKDFGERIHEIDLQKVYTKAQKTLARHIENTENQLPDLKRLMKLWRQGMAGKDWYAKANKEVHQIFGEDAPVFLDMLAATSPDTSVQANVTFALAAYKQWKLGEPFGLESHKYPAPRNMLYRIAAGEKDWVNPNTAPKVYNFRRNLHGDTEAVTVDRWMADTFGFGRGGGLTDARYKFIDYALTQAAKKAGVSPRDFQAGLWRGIKEETARKLEKQGKAATITREARDFGAILKDVIDNDPELARMVNERGSWTKKSEPAAEALDSGMPDWVTSEPAFEAPVEKTGFFGSERGSFSLRPKRPARELDKTQGFIDPKGRTHYGTKERPGHDDIAAELGFQDKRDAMQSGHVRFASYGLDRPGVPEHVLEFVDSPQARRNAVKHLSKAGFGSVVIDILDPSTGRYNSKRYGDLNSAIRDMNVMSSESGALSVGEISKAASDAAHSFEREIIDRYADIRRFTEAAKLPRDQDPYVAVRLYSGRGGKIERRLRRPGGLQDVIRPAYKKGILKPMREYALLERFEELAGRGISKFPDGRTLADIQAEKLALEAKLGPAKLAEIKSSLDQLRKFTDRMLIEARDGELISDAAYNAIRGKNQKYVPLQRLDFLADNMEGMPVGSNLFSVASQDVIRAIHGSERKVADPFESIIRNVYKTVALVERNKVALKMADLSARPEFAGKVVKLKTIKGRHGYQTESAPIGFEKFSVMRKGRKEEYAAPAVVVQAMKGLTNKQTDLVTKMMSTSGAWLRAGATSLNAAFIPANTIRDFLTAHIVSEVGFTPIDWMRGLSMALRRGKEYDRYLESGAAFAGFFEQYKSPASAVKDLTGQLTLKKAVSFVNPLEYISFLGERLEMVPRMATFARAERQGRTMSDAAFVSRNATVDFAKAGSTMKVANLWVPFLNARLQGTLNMAGALGHHPGRAALAVTGLIGIPTLLTYFHNTTNHPEIWNDIAQFEKDGNIIIIYGDERDEEGNPTQVIKLPKGDAKVFANPLEGFLEHLYSTNKPTFRRMAIQWLSDISPIEFEREGKFDPMRAGGSVLPPLAKAGVESITNKNLYTGRDIVPMKGRLQQASPEEQYKTTTPKTVVKIAQFLGISPLKLENAIGTQFGGLGRQLMPAADLLVYGETEARSPATQVMRRFHGARGGGGEEEELKELESASQESADEYARANRNAEGLYKSIIAAPQAKKLEVFQQFVRTEQERLNAAQDPLARASAERVMVGTVKALGNLVHAKAEGLTTYERVLRSKPVSVRAERVLVKLRSLPQEKRAETFERWLDKGIITKAVLKEIAAQAQAQSQ